MTTIDDDFGPRFRQEQREREQFLRNTRESNRTTTVTQQIDRAIADAGGSTRDALNNVLAGRDVAVALGRAENERAVALMVALEEIRAVVWMFGVPSQSMEDIDKIACDALKAAGEMATSTTTEED